MPPTGSVRPSAMAVPPAPWMRRFESVASAAFVVSGDTARQDSRGQEEVEGGDSLSWPFRRQEQRPRPLALTRSAGWRLPGSWSGPAVRWAGRSSESDAAVECGGPEAPVRSHRRRSWAGLRTRLRRASPVTEDSAGQVTLSPSLPRGCQTNATCPPPSTDRMDSPAPPTCSGLTLRGRPAFCLCAAPPPRAPGLEVMAP